MPNIIIHPEAMKEMQETYDSMKGESEETKIEILNLVWKSPVVEAFLNEKQ